MRTLLVWVIDLMMVPQYLNGNFINLYQKPTKWLLDRGFGKFGNADWNLLPTQLPQQTVPRQTSRSEYIEDGNEDDGREKPHSKINMEGPTQIYNRSGKRKQMQRTRSNEVGPRPGNSLTHKSGNNIEDKHQTQKNNTVSSKAHFSRKLNQQVLDDTIYGRDNGHKPEQNADDTHNDNPNPIHTVHKDRINHRKGENKGQKPTMVQNINSLQNDSKKGTRHLHFNKNSRRHTDVNGHVKNIAVNRENGISHDRNPTSNDVAVDLGDGTIQRTTPNSNDIFVDLEHESSHWKTPNSNDIGVDRSHDDIHWTTPNSNDIATDRGYDDIHWTTPDSNNIATDRGYDDILWTTPDSNDIGTDHEHNSNHWTKPNSNDIAFDRAKDDIRWTTPDSNYIRADGGHGGMRDPIQNLNDLSIDVQFENGQETISNWNRDIPHEHSHRRSKSKTHNNIKENHRVPVSQIQGIINQHDYADSDRQYTKEATLKLTRERDGDYTPNRNYDAIIDNYGQIPNSLRVQSANKNSLGQIHDHNHGSNRNAHDVHAKHHRLNKESRVNGFAHTHSDKDASHTSSHQNADYNKYNNGYIDNQNKHSNNNQNVHEDSYTSSGNTKKPVRYKKQIQTNNYQRNKFGKRHEEQILNEGEGKHMGDYINDQKPQMGYQQDVIRGQNENRNSGLDYQHTDRHEHYINSHDDHDDVDHGHNDFKGQNTNFEGNSIDDTHTSSKHQYLYENNNEHGNIDKNTQYHEHHQSHGANYNDDTNSNLFGLDLNHPAHVKYGRGYGHDDMHAGNENNAHEQDKIHESIRNHQRDHFHHTHGIDNVKMLSDLQGNAIENKHKNSYLRSQIMHLSHESNNNGAKERVLRNHNGYGDDKHYVTNLNVDEGRMNHRHQHQKHTTGNMHHSHTHDYNDHHHEGVKDKLGNGNINRLRNIVQGKAVVDHRTRQHEGVKDKYLNGDNHRTRVITNTNMNNLDYKDSKDQDLYINVNGQNGEFNDKNFEIKTNASENSADNTQDMMQNPNIETERRIVHDRDYIHRPQKQSFDQTTYEQNSALGDHEHGTHQNDRQYSHDNGVEHWHSINLDSDGSETEYSLDDADDGKDANLKSKNFEYGNSVGSEPTGESNQDLDLFRMRKNSKRNSITSKHVKCHEPNAHNNMIMVNVGNGPNQAWRRDCKRNIRNYDFPFNLLEHLMCFIYQFY